MTPPFFLVGIVVVLALLTVLTVVLVLGVVGVIKPVHAQVEVKQSTTLNGHTTNINQVCDGTPRACVSGLVMKLTGTPGAIKVTDTGSDISIHYCVSHDTGDRCKDYKMYYNGTISEVK